MRYILVLIYYKSLTRIIRPHFPSLNHIPELIRAQCGASSTLVSVCLVLSPADLALHSRVQNLSLCTVSHRVTPCHTCFATEINGDRAYCVLIF